MKVALYCEYRGREKFRIREERMLKFVHHFFVYYHSGMKRPFHIRFECSQESIHIYSHEVEKHMKEEIWTLLPLRAQEYYRAHLPVVRKTFFHI